MKRSLSSRLIDLVVLEPLLFLVILAVVSRLPGLAAPEVSVDLAVGLLVGSAATVINLLGLWIFVYIRLPGMAFGGATKALWALVLFLGAPVSLPWFYWRFLRHEFLPDRA
ncbi:MAG TPA: hypothetical protein V6D05_05705 [Stenomitos sp.]